MRTFEGFQKGINLGGWMSQCDYSQHRLDTFITEEDFRTIAALGMDHVRLPFDYNIVETENGAEYIEDGFRRIGEAVRLAEKYGLNIVLDLHKTCGFSFDVGEAQTGFFENEALQERFYRLWEQMARRFGAQWKHVAFELLNEVTDASYSKTWNRIAATCIRRIRAIAPDTWILVGSYWNNHASAVKAMDAPYDSKVVYNFHSYDPLFFTHQGAPWVKELDQARRVSFAESGVTPDYFEELFAEAIAYAEKNDAPLYCGEYGVIDRSQPADVVEWYKCINAVFTKHHIGRATWSWHGMDFDLRDRMKDYHSELAKYL